MARPQVLAVVFYGLLSAAAVAWSLAQGREITSYGTGWPLFEGVPSTVTSLVAGLAVAALTVATTPALLRRARWAKALEALVRDWLKNATRTDVVLLAVASGVGEELFFRGALLPAIGLTGSSVVFGLLHLGPVRTMWPWTVWAIAMGYVFGAMFLATGSLVGPIVAHVLINGINLGRMLRPSPP